MMCDSMDSSPEIMDQKYNSLRLSPAGSSRILYDMPCKVCRDHSSGKHYGIYACDGCAGFFKRSIRRGRQYVCKSQKQGHCTMDKTHRNQCRACRLRKCFEAGMNKDAVQHERGPRNSTLRRHMAMYKEAVLGPDFPQLSHEILMNSAALNGFPGVPMPISGPPMPNHHPMSGGFHPAPVVLDLSVPRVGPHHHQHPIHPAHPALFGPTTAYMNVLASRVLPPPQSSISAVLIRETAADHLFRNIRWLKNVRAFSELPENDQHFLLEETWKELFILAIAQHLLPFSLAQLFFAYEVEQPNRDILNRISGEIYAFQDVLNQLRLLNVDHTEYECLRVITLFRKPATNGNDDLANTSICTGGGSPSSSTSGESRGLLASAKVLALHNDARNALLNYINRTHPNQPLRFQTILGVASLMNKISCFTIEEVFFRKDIGEATIMSFISKVYEN